ncbi:hypothetical protein Avbf_10096 [Armadillidium vulgare]|nr:hypothetical protein Avbf_10096 [Armadillidium vulgare]
MEFFCYICHKLMNSVHSLEQHAISGQHLRKKSEGEDIQFTECDVSEYSFSELIQYAPVPVIGLQYIEAYEDDPDSVYYKCNLCGDHGDKCYIYHHVIGDQHTDKYIGIKVKLERVDP